MKNILIPVITVAVLFASCAKNDQKPAASTVENPKPSLLQKVASQFTDLNPEATRIVDEVSKADYSIGIVDNSNFGFFSSSPEHDVYINGKSPNDVSVNIASTIYSPSPTGQWFQEGLVFKTYFDRQVPIEIMQGRTRSSYSIRVPKYINATKLGALNSVTIPRTGNVLNWSPDPNNASGKVFLYYRLFSNDDWASGVTMYKTDGVVLDDNGSYNIDGLISGTQAKRINFILVRGNTVSFTATNGQKVLLNFRSCDHHEYIIQ